MRKTLMLMLLLAATFVATYARQLSSAGLAKTEEASAQGATTPSATFQPRLLITLPPGIAVKTTQLPYALLFSTDGRRVAYYARYRVGELMNEAVVLGDARGPEAAFIVQAALSPDGSRIAYLASFRDNVRAAFLIIGNRRDQVQITEGMSGPQWVPVFSPDAKRLAYKAETAGGKHVIRVADVADISTESHTDATYTQLTYVSGPEFDDVDQAQFSADSLHFTYAARDRGKWTIVVDGTPGSTFEDASDPVFRADGRVVFRATRDKQKYFVVVGEQEGPGFDVVSRPAVSPDGSTIAHGAKEGSKYWIVVGSEKRPAEHLADQVVFSSDGKRVAYWTKESKPGSGSRLIFNNQSGAQIQTGSKERLIVNDKPGPEFDQVGWPTFDDSATVDAYWARDKNKYVMVAGDRRSDRFDGVGRTRVFSPDGSELAFGVLQGDKLRWTVMKTH